MNLLKAIGKLLCWVFVEEILKELLLMLAFEKLTVFVREMALKMKKVLNL
jgi:hypothetical protein